MNGKRDLFAVMIALKLAIPQVEFRRLVKEIDIALKNLYSHTIVLSEEIVLKSMGFPADWKNKLLQK